MRRITASIALISALAAVAPARAADLKALGRLEIPPGARVTALCTDPVLQSVLSTELSANQPSSIARGSSDGPTVTVTVTLSTHVLAPGVSLAEIAPGDPAAAEMLRDLGAEPPPLGDSGDKATDPYEEEARRQATNPEDPLTQQFRSYQAFRQSMSGRNAPTPYDNIPQNQIYDTVLIARATMAGSVDDIKVVALVHPDESLHHAKEAIAERIADSLPH